MTSRGLALSAAVLGAAALLSGCTAENNALDRASTCPGPGCQADVRRLLDRVEDVPGVIGVTRAHREHVLGKPLRVDVEFRATRSDRASAEALARQVLALVDDSQIEPEQARVRLVFDPPRMVPGKDGAAGWSRAAAGDPCADAACTTELADLRRRIRSEVPRLRVDEVTYDGKEVAVTGAWPGPEDAAYRSARARVRELIDASDVRPRESYFYSFTTQEPDAVEVTSGR